MADSRLKLALTALVGAGTALWGWLGWLAILWVTVMALDYLSGTLAALKQGCWCSARAREGLWHKGGMLLAVLCAALADIALDLLLGHVGLALPLPVQGLMTPLVLAWYSLTELGSILENAGRLGAQIPEGLRRVLKQGADSLKNGENRG